MDGFDSYQASTARVPAPMNSGCVRSAGKKSGTASTSRVAALLIAPSPTLVKGQDRHMRHPLILTVLLATGSAIVLTSCGNYVNVELSGRTGVSHDGNGNLSLHVNTCDNSTRRVTVGAGREGLAGDEENPVIGSYSLDEPASGSFAIHIQDPSPWSVEHDLTLPEDPSHFFIVSAWPEDTGGPAVIRPEKFFANAAVTYDGLMAAPPETVVSGVDGLSFATAEEFNAACPTE